MNRLSTAEIAEIRERVEKATRDPRTEIHIRGDASAILADFEAADSEPARIVELPNESVSVLLADRSRLLESHDAVTARVESLEAENARLRGAGAALQSAYTQYAIAGTTSAKQRARVECEEKLESLFAALSETQQ